MKILIAISSKNFSEPTLNAGMKVAKAFNSSSTILEVGKKISEFSMKEVSMARERIESWNFDRPGVDVLEWAFNYLCELKLIDKSNRSKGFPKKTLIDDRGRRSQVFLQGVVYEDISLIIRNGDIIEELRSEVQSEKYDVTIVGGSKKGNLSFDMVQYIDSSVFIVKNYQSSFNYRILLAVDSSKGTKKAIKYSVRVAQAFNIGVDIITVAKEEKYIDRDAPIIKTASKFLRRCKIDHNILHDVGDPVDVIPRLAGSDHILIMGSSTKGPIRTFFQSSKPIKILKECNCPILIVK